MTPPIVIHRLSPDDVALARDTFALVARVFEEPSDGLSDSYVATLLARPSLWALAALHDGVPVGGVIAHALPMTRTETTELFLYDIAVDPAYQRQGIGRALVGTLRALAAAEQITVAFVPADNDDEHALDFYRALGGDPAPVTIFTFES